jgi:hypothetical protein
LAVCDSIIIFQDSLDTKIDELKIGLGEEEENLRRAKFDYQVRCIVLSDKNFNKTFFHLV